MSNITTNIETITPKQAREWIDKNLCPEKQRNINGHRVNEYARAIKTGQWALTHQGIAFDDDGIILDGQHRLHAIVDANIPVKMMVTRGLPAIASQNGIELRTFDVIDRGRGRGIGQQLKQHGLEFGSGNTVAGMCSSILKACVHPSAHLTTPLALHIIEAYGQSIEFCVRYAKKSTPGLRRAAFLGACAFAHKSHEEKMIEFYFQVVTGENIRRGLPSYVLREYLINKRHGSNGSAGTWSDIQATLLCAMHHVQGNDLQILKVAPSGVEFFWNKQKGHVRKIRQAYGYEE